MRTGVAVGSTDAFCIGCGCSDHDPCFVTHRGGTTPCGWVVVNRKQRRGVCSAPHCRLHLNRWDRGERELSEEAKARAGARANA